MTRPLLFTADFGTSGVKAVVWTTNLVPLVQAYRAYDTRHPAPYEAEQDPQAWWCALRDVVTELFSTGGVRRSDLAGIGFSGHYPSVLPVSERGEALTPALIWMDERGTDECKALRGVLDSMHASNKNQLRGFYPLPKILWLKRHQPEVFTRTYKFAQVVTYITAKLTGDFAIDPSAASWFHTFDYITGTWSEDICQQVGVPVSMHPRIDSASSILGTVTRAAANETGLPEGCPVIVGTGDAISAALGAGIIDHGQAYMTTGTGGCVCVVTDKPRFASGLITEAFAIPGQWLIEGVVKNIGAVLKWFKSRFGPTTYALMDEEAATQPAGAQGLIFLPYMSGEQSPIDDPDARGLLYGLTLSTERGQIIRAFMEGVAYAIRDNISAIETAGQYVQEIRGTGGPIRSRVWSQIFADVLQKRILVPDEQDTAPRGAAILLGKALGLWKDVREAASMTQSHRVVEPDPSLQGVYDEGFRRYKKLYTSVKHALSREYE